jgi:nitronate monooxygenase
VLTYRAPSSFTRVIAQLAVPVIAAPMAGGPSTPELAAAVSTAGGLGFLAAGYLTADALAGQLDRAAELTAQPVGVNLFVPGAPSTADTAAYADRLAAEARRYGAEPGVPAWDDDHYPAKLDLLVQRAAPVVSFTFGRPDPDDVRRLHDAGSQVVVTVTSPAEARLAAEVGADALCVQGSEAGGHQSRFTDDADAETFGLLSLLRLVGAETELPLIAAGGIVHGADLAAVLAAGAVAGQCGTAFLRCPEAGTQPAQRAALAAGDRPTAFTRAFSGRTARGLVNRFLTEHSAAAPAAYPDVHRLTRPIRAAAGKAGDPEAMSLWAGQTYPLAGEAPAAEVVAALHEQAVAALRRLHALLGLDQLS